MRETNKRNLFIVILAILVPGAGHVFSNKQVRGLIYIFWIFSMGYITWRFTSDYNSFIIRCSGGLLVWVMSVVEIARN